MPHRNKEDSNREFIDSLTRILQKESDGPGPDTDRLIRRILSDAVKEPAPKQFFLAFSSPSVRKAALAFGAVLVFIIVSFPFLNRESELNIFDTNNLAAFFTFGKGERGECRELYTTSVLSSSAKWNNMVASVKEKGKLVLRSRTEILSLSGPALIEVERDAQGCVLGIRLHFGELSVFDPSSEPKAEKELSHPPSLAVHTDQYLYKKTGTRARLKVTTGSENLQVLEGSFDVSGEGIEAAVRVGSRQEFSGSGIGGPILRLMKNGEVASLQKELEHDRERAERFLRLRKEISDSLPGIRPLPPPEIEPGPNEKKVTVRLQSGRMVRGYLRLEDGIFHVLNDQGDRETFPFDLVIEVQSD